MSNKKGHFNSSDELFDRLFNRLGRKKQIAALVVIIVIFFLFIGTQVQFFPLGSDVTVHVSIRFASAYSTFNVYLVKVDEHGIVQDSTLEALEVVFHQGLWQGASTNTYSSNRWTFIKIIVNDIVDGNTFTLTTYGIFAVPKHALLLFPSYYEVSATLNVTISSNVLINSVNLR